MSMFKAAKMAALLAVTAYPFAVSTSQVLPPPSLPGQDRLVQRLVKAIEQKDVNAYAALLADDVIVYEDHSELARGKSAWLKQIGEKLNASGVKFKVVDGFSSTGRVMIVQYENTVASWGNDAPPAHCCWSYDAYAYDVRGGLIVAIHRLRGGDKKLTLN